MLKNSIKNKILFVVYPALLCVSLTLSGVLFCRILDLEKTCGRLLTGINETMKAEKPPAADSNAAGMIIRSGDSVVISVVAEQANDIYGYQFRLYFNTELLEYDGGIVSRINDIPTIFAKEYDAYLLVGAVKTGAEAGYSGEDVSMCQITLTAKSDMPRPEISIGEINVVKSDLTYMENITGWKVETARE
jgi:hypothetical protein